MNDKNTSTQMYLKATVLFILQYIFLYWMQSSYILIIMKIKFSCIQIICFLFIQNIQSYKDTKF